MPLTIAFLRAVNVGGRTVKMEALRTTFEALSLNGVDTYIASGNVIFECRARDTVALETRIEARLAVTFGFDIHTFLRTADELAALVQRPVFDPSEVAAAATHVIGFLRSPPDAQALAALERLTSPADRLAVQGRELHWLSSHKQSEATFSNALFERTLKLRTTFRSMSMLRKLTAKLGPPA